MILPVCAKEPRSRKRITFVPFVFFVVRNSLSLRCIVLATQAIRRLRGLPDWARRLPGDWPNRFWKAAMKLFTWE